MPLRAAHSFGTIAVRMHVSAKSLRWLATSLAACLWLYPALAGAADPAAPTPPSTTAESTNPPSMPERSEQIQALAKSLADTADRYGNDAVALQAALLIETIASGAVGASEVTVVGPSQRAGASFLHMRVVSGHIFDSEASTPQTRLASLWERVALPALARLETLEMHPRGLHLQFAYGVQSFSDGPGGHPDPQAPYESRTMSVLVPPEALDDLVHHVVVPSALLERCSVDSVEEAFVEPPPTSDGQ